MPFRTVTYTYPSQTDTSKYTATVYYTDLTTVFTPCYTPIQIWHTKETSCVPDNYYSNVYSYEFYSPGICPEGHTVACEAWTAWWDQYDEYYNSSVSHPWCAPRTDETAMHCAPSGYSCYSNYFHSVRSGSEWAPAIEIRWRSSDIEEAILETHPLYPGSTLWDSSKAAMVPECTGSSSSCNSDDTGDGKLSNGVIAGIASGGALGVMLFVALLFVFCRNQRRVKQMEGAGAPQPVSISDAGPHMLGQVVVAEQERKDPIATIAASGPSASRTDVRRLSKPSKSTLLEQPSAIAASAARRSAASPLPQDRTSTMSSTTVDAGFVGSVTSDIRSKTTSPFGGSVTQSTAHAGSIRESTASPSSPASGPGEATGRSGALNMVDLVAPVPPNNEPLEAGSGGTGAAKALPEVPEFSSSFRPRDGGPNPIPGDSSWSNNRATLPPTSSAVEAPVTHPATQRHHSELDSRTLSYTDVAHSQWQAERRGPSGSPSSAGAHAGRASATYPHGSVSDRQSHYNEARREDAAATDADTPPAGWDALSAPMLPVQRGDLWPVPEQEVPGSHTEPNPDQGQQYSHHQQQHSQGQYYADHSWYNSGQHQYSGQPHNQHASQYQYDAQTQSGYYNPPAQGQAHTPGQEGGYYAGQENLGLSAASPSGSQHQQTQYYYGQQDYQRHGQEQTGQYPSHSTQSYQEHQHMHSHSQAEQYPGRPTYSPHESQSYYYDQQQQSPGGSYPGYGSGWSSSNNTNAGTGNRE